jgi:hypothetical protein
MKYLISIALLALSLAVNAQDAIRRQASIDFRLVNMAYAQASRLKMDVNYTLFPSYTSTTPFEESRGVFMKQGENSYSNLLGIISLSNSKATVTLDSNEQTIVVADPSTHKSGEPNLVELDTLLSTCSSIEFKELEGVKYYKLKFDGVLFSEYNAIEVFIDSKTNFLGRITMFFRIELDLDEENDRYINEKPRLEIIYTGVTTNPVFTPDQFSETKFVGIRGKIVTAAAAYAKYRVVNNRISRQ